MSTIVRGENSSPCQGRLIVVSGPSGVGKDAMLESIFDLLPGVVRSVSATTRPPRPAEIDGKDYHFLSREEFEKGIDSGYFYEYAEYGGNLYGTPKSKVDEQRAAGNDVILKIEVQGAELVKKLSPEASLVFIKPPSIEELERRLRARKTDTEDKIAERLNIALSELSQCDKYDYHIVNDDLDMASARLKDLILSLRKRC